MKHWRSTCSIGWPKPRSMPSDSAATSSASRICAVSASAATGPRYPQAKVRARHRIRRHVGAALCGGPPWMLRSLLDHDVVAGTPVERVIPGSSVEHVVAGPAQQRVRAGAADQHVVAVAAVGAQLDCVCGEPGCVEGVVAVDCVDL